MENTDENVYVVKTFIDDDDLINNELDFELHKEFGFEYTNDNDFIIFERGDGSAYDSHPVDIDKFINSLLVLKEKGANYVQIDYHTDHISYEISGYKIELASQVDIDKYYETKKKLKQKQDIIDQKEKELRELKNSK